MVYVDALVTKMLHQTVQIRKKNHISNIWVFVRRFKTTLSP